MKTGLKIPQGFTLVELMIVVAIIGIFAAIAYPSYQSQVRKSRRADAQTALAELAQLQENFFAQNNNKYAKYNEDTEADPNKKFINIVQLNGFTADETSITSKDGYYSITLSVPTNRSFLLKATALPGTTQEKDVDCQTFSINHQGLKTSGPENDCW